MERKRFYLKAAGANEEVEDTAKNIGMLALLGFEQLCYWPSTVAAGLVILASRVVNQNAACHRVKEVRIKHKASVQLPLYSYPNVNANR